MWYDTCVSPLIGGIEPRHSGEPASPWKPFAASKHTLGRNVRQIALGVRP